MRHLSNYFRPETWVRVFSRIKTARERVATWRLIDIFFDQNIKQSENGAKEVILIDGLWDNPNHYFRSYLLILSLTRSKNYRLIGLLKNPKDRARHSLSAMGCTEFVFIEDFPINNSDALAAELLLKKVKTHADVLRLKLPQGLPANIFYDTVLKVARSPRPDLGSSIWKQELADVFRLSRFYADVFSEIRVKHLILSHPWKNEFGVALWQGLRKNINCFYVTGNYEAMRVRRFTSAADFFSPSENIQYSEFCALGNSLRKKLTLAGDHYLSNRTKGRNTDINESLAYKGKQTARDLYHNLQLANGKKNILVCFHAWFDFPHANQMKNFTDFLDWANCVLDIVRQKDDVIWILKPHPTEPWYGGFKLIDLLVDLPPNVRVLDEQTSIDASLNVADAVVTVHGTVAIEAAARGLPVICADNASYGGWNFAKISKNRTEFVTDLLKIDQQQRLSQQLIDEAKAFAYLHLAPTDESHGCINLLADNVGLREMFYRIGTVVIEQKQTLIKHVFELEKWLQSDASSFSISVKIDAFRTKSGELRE